MRSFTKTTAVGAALLALVAAAPGTAAKVKKADCKAYAATIERLSDDLGIAKSVGTTAGRGLLDSVQAWIGKNDDATVEATAAELEKTLAGIKECESNGFYSQVSRVKSNTLTLKSAVLPWLKNAAALDPCQDTIAKAMEKRASDPDGAISDLQGAIGECRDITWVREARRQLAEAHFVRGDLSRSDYAEGRSQVEQTLATLGDMEAEQRTTVVAILGTATVGGGKSLMEAGSFEEAAVHWSAYIDLFGTPSFDPLFAATPAPEGSYELRSLRDAGFQWALACLETGDGDCVGSRIDAMGTDGAEAIDALESLVGRAFERAAAASGAEADRYSTLGFNLLDRWHTGDPDSYQIKRMLQNEVLDRPSDQRLALLRLTGHCWIPTEIAGMLREEGREFVDEATIAASCGGGGGEAAAMLAAVEVERARSLLDRVILADSSSERRSLETELTAMLDSIGDTQDTREIREGLEAERARQRAQVANRVDNSQEIYQSCTTILATIQWNESREEDYAAELRNFKAGCCSFLRRNKSGWVRHLQSKLGEDQVRAKQELMDSYCGG